MISIKNKYSVNFPLQSDCWVNDNKDSKDIYDMVPRPLCYFKRTQYSNENSKNNKY